MSAFPIEPEPKARGDFGPALTAGFRRSRPPRTPRLRDRVRIAPHQHVDRDIADYSPSFVTDPTSFLDKIKTSNPPPRFNSRFRFTKEAFRRAANQ
jgi:hypothetical protein